MRTFEKTSSIPAERPPASHRWRAVALALALATAAVLLVRFARHEPIDDAFIVFRYAQNLLAGEGLVFNPGERVEGYTDLLWVLTLAALRFVGLDFELAARLVGGLFALLCVWTLGRFFPRPRSPAWLALAAPWLLAVHPTFALWAVHGLETSMFALLVLLGVRADVRVWGEEGTAGWGWMWLGLATLTRPEGLALFAGCLAHRLLGDRRAGWRALGRAALGYAAIVGAQLLFRLAYYGELLPNTFHAKVGATAAGVARGLEYVGGFLAPPGGLLFWLALPALYAARRDPEVRHLLVAAGALLGAVALVGGDVFAGHRFLMPALPLLLLLVQEGLRQLLRGCDALAARRRRWAVAGRVAVAVAAAAGQVVASVEEAARRIENGDDFVTTRRLVGEALRGAFPAGTTVALNPVGVLPFVSGLPAIDMLGLVDRHIARVEVARMGEGAAGHEKGDGAYVLARRPDLILIGNVTVLPAGRRPGPVSLMPAGRSEYQILRHADFARLYTLDSLRLADGRQLLFARRRDLPPPAGGGGS